MLRFDVEAAFCRPFRGKNRNGGLSGSFLVEQVSSPASSSDREIKTNRGWGHPRYNSLGQLESCGHAASVSGVPAKA